MKTTLIVAVAAVVAVMAVVVGLIYWVKVSKVL